MADGRRDRPRPDGTVDRSPRSRRGAPAQVRPRAAGVAVVGHVLRGAGRAGHRRQLRQQGSQLGGRVSYSNLTLDNYREALEGDSTARSSSVLIQGMRTTITRHRAVPVDRLPARLLAGDQAPAAARVRARRCWDPVLHELPDPHDRLEDRARTQGADLEHAARLGPHRPAAVNCSTAAPACRSASSTTTCR